MRVIAYTYEADLHCIACTQARASRNGFALTDPLGHGPGTDENGIPYAATDREGNAVHPVFSTDEMSFSICGTCHETIPAVRVIPQE